MQNKYLSINYLIAILCVVGISVGQILFKLSAIALQQTGNIFNRPVLIPLMTALALYGTTTLVWIWVLQKFELGCVYPLMALAFILVPLGSHFFLGERFQSQYFIGTVFIVVGIIIALKT